MSGDVRRLTGMNPGRILRTTRSHPHYTRGVSEREKVDVGSHVVPLPCFQTWRFSVPSVYTLAHLGRTIPVRTTPFPSPSVTFLPSSTHGPSKTRGLRCRVPSWTRTVLSDLCLPTTVFSQIGVYCDYRRNPQFFGGSVYSFGTQPQFGERS